MDLEQIVVSIVDRYHFELVDCPGSARYHHNYRNGLAEHVDEMLDMAVASKEATANTDINWDLVIAGIALHDIGKIREYKIDENDVITKTGLNHIEEGLKIWEEYRCDEPWWEGVRHIIASHHGRLEWGALEEPRTPEAWIVHALDLASSKAGRVK